MKTKFIITSVFSFVSVSLVQASDAVVPKQHTSVVSPVIVSPSFSWAGFYFGGQVSGFSSKLSAKMPDVDIPLFPDKDGRNKEWVSVEKKYMPKLSGVIGGFYAGSNVDFGNNVILGVDTDINFIERKNTKAIVVNSDGFDYARNPGLVGMGPQIPRKWVDGDAIANRDNVALRSIGGGRKKRAADIEVKAGENGITFSHTIKQKWTGATRMRIGLSADRIMPYIAGGVAYGQLQDILSISVSGEDGFNSASDATNTMIGYTFGGGIDFAMTDTFVVRAEYRYSDFGKKKFKDEIEIKYRTNDFRAGVAYKF
ncbi:outer membrane protein [Bartonella sp. CB169]|uniref:outer membrane protein n=1 Tax=Bartonella sp. CB169 TaxID=3112257 RepID=UPI00300E41B3